jgi:small subunit ribosomal protein S20
LEAFFKFSFNTKSRTQRNLVLKENLKKASKKIEELVSSKKINEAKKSLSSVYKTIDKAAKRNIIKKNTANRKKSRLTGLINKAEGKKTETPKEKK